MNVSFSRPNMRQDHATLLCS